MSGWHTTKRVVYTENIPLVKTCAKCGKRLDRAVALEAHRYNVNHRGNETDTHKFYHEHCDTTKAGLKAWKDWRNEIIRLENEKDIEADRERALNLVRDGNSFHIEDNCGYVVITVVVTE